MARMIMTIILIDTKITIIYEDNYLILGTRYFIKRLHLNKLSTAFTLFHVQKQHGRFRLCHEMQAA